MIISLQSRFISVNAHSSSAIAVPNFLTTTFRRPGILFSVHCRTTLSLSLSLHTYTQAFCFWIFYFHIHFLIHFFLHFSRPGECTNWPESTKRSFNSSKALWQHYVSALWILILEIAQHLATSHLLEMALLMY